jgi:hypothetical protein
MSDFMKATLINKEMLAIHQDSFGISGGLCVSLWSPRSHGRPVHGRPVFPWSCSYKTCFFTWRALIELRCRVYNDTTSDGCTELATGPRFSDESCAATASSVWNCQMWARPLSAERRTVGDGTVQQERKADDDQGFVFRAAAAANADHRGQERARGCGADGADGARCMYGRGRMEGSGTPQR